MTFAAGADGCRAGWVLARFDGRQFTFAVGPDFRWVESESAGALALGVDMPIILASTGNHRACDLLAKQRLGPRASTIFHAPPASLLACATYTEALALSRQLYGRGISKQTFHLLPKIREVQGTRAIEVHPELAFLEMNGGRPLPPKKTPAGQTLRSRLIGVEVARIRGTKPDDILDAAAVAWTAWRFAHGTAIGLGEENGAAIWF